MSKIDTQCFVIGVNFSSFARTHSVALLPHPVGPGCQVSIINTQCLVIGVYTCNFSSLARTSSVALLPDPVGPVRSRIQGVYK